MKKIFTSLLLLILSSCLVKQPATEFSVTENTADLYSKTCLLIEHPNLETKLLYKWSQDYSNNELYWNQVMSSTSVGDIDSNRIYSNVVGDLKVLDGKIGQLI